MASRLKPVTICDLCEKVYDPNRDMWMRLTEYRASYGEPADSYAFTETFCDACHTLYSAMIGMRKEANRATCSIVGNGFMATSAPEVDHGLA